MYTVPAGFTKRLEHEFQGRIRLRWSSANHEFQVEQRVRRGAHDGPIRSSKDDAGIRQRDGYLYLFSIRPGTKMPCPRCTQDLSVPVAEIREISCESCKLHGREHRVIAGYFPLNDTLIEHLKKLDPERGASQRLNARVLANNIAHQSRLGQSVVNHASDKLRDDFSRIAGIPQVGYTGKEFRG